LANETPVPFGEELSRLEPYASLLRYQDGPTPTTREDAAEAIAVAEKVLQWAQGIVNGVDVNLG
jgi:HEPN domain-containing protein